MYDDICVDFHYFPYNFICIESRPRNLDNGNWTGPGKDIINKTTDDTFYLIDPSTCLNCSEKVTVNDREYPVMPEVCYFKAFRDEGASSEEKYELDMEWWQVFACKLAFVLCFEVRGLLPAA